MRERLFCCEAKEYLIFNESNPREGLKIARKGFKKGVEWAR